MAIRRKLIASFTLFGLGCTHFDTEPPVRADGLTTVLVITTELEPSIRDELGAELAVRTEVGGYALAVSYDADGLRMLPGCTVPITYDWMRTSGLRESHDSDDALFVVAEAGRTDAFVPLDRDASVQFQTQRWAALPDDYLLPDPFAVEACAGATHVIREFMFGITESDDSEALVCLWIEPLPTDEQWRWEARKHRGEAVGTAVLITLTTITLASVAVFCLTNLDNCESYEDDDPYARDDASSVQGTELGRTRRVQAEAGAGGFVLRF